ncbi:MAG: hypothetical protein GY938_25840, partial [Ketobacter sp.]|nr:hypothetical protein [Ketobacter sp.]
EAIDADIMEWVRAGQPEEWTGNPVFELEPGRMMTMKEAKESELIRQPCVERMCFRYDEKSGVFIYCEDLRLVEGGELKACMPSSENKSECVCNCYAYPEAWNRKGGCPRSTVPYEIDRPKKVKKVNPLKASKRGAR